MKYCPICKRNLPLNCYHKDKCSKSGFHSICKECRSISLKKYYKSNIDKIHIKNLNYYKINKDEVKKQVKEYRKKNSDKISISRKLYRLNNITEVIKRDREYRKKNRLKINKRSNNRFKNKWNNDPQFKLSISIKNKLRAALNSNNIIKNNRSLLYTGCNITELKNYLESKFLPGMNWKNHNKDGWHIDHIRPCASFDLTDPEQQKSCFHYTNLQPLWGKDNLSKGSFYNGIRYKYNK